MSYHSKYICQLPSMQQKEMREKLRKYLQIEGLTGDKLEEELQSAMDSKVDDIDWKAIDQALKK